MRRFLTAFFILLLTSAKCADLKEITDFGPNPGNLRSYFYDPFKQKDTLARPMVIILHGCNQNANVIVRESGWDQLAEEKGIYLLCPEQKVINNASRCFNWFLQQDRTIDQGEMASVRSMLNYVLSFRRIDKHKIFIYGLSAGAFMSVAFMANYPESIQAGAICAGGPYSDQLQLGSSVNKTPQEWGDLVRKIHGPGKMKFPRMLILQGLKDKIVKPELADELTEQWTNLHNIKDHPTAVDTLQAGKLTIYRSCFINSTNERILEKLFIKELGHYLVVDPGKGKDKGGKTGLFTVDKDWFSTGYILQFFGLQGH